ncbi:MAG: adenylyltransferase/cytidyltransferase family protein [Elusimicrobia bacterium]|nr:adenylyltransferase/cytidyltransferase family protein [Elusimicrobiota bacterium]
MPKTNVRGSSKIKTLRQLQGILAKARRQGRKIALCHGVFDLVHPGHIVHFRQAHEHGDLVAVTVTPDRFVNKGPGRPVFGEHMRLETLAALEPVDFVALNEWPTATEAIKLLKPHVYVKGPDYADAAADLTGKITEEEEAVESVGGRLVCTSGFTSSSSHLLNRFFNSYPASTQEYLRRFRAKHSPDKVIGQLKKLSHIRPLVVGEAILDQYCYCHPVGKSPKETIVSTRFISMESFAGGAVATANHLAGFCREVTLLTALGPDKEEEAFLRGRLRPNIRMEVLRTPQRPTVRKRRFLEPSFMTKMFEIQYLDDSPIGPDLQAALGSMIEKEAPRHNLTVVNDFGHGLLPTNLRRQLSSGRNFLALNTQSNSANHGYNTVTNYRRADYVSIDDPELRLASRDKYGDLADLVTHLKSSLRCQSFLVSLGPKGSVILAKDGWQEAPALATRIVDRTGAGDALFAITSLCAFKGIPADIHLFVGNCVGALAVEIVCNREPVEPVALHKFIHSILK